MKHVVLVTMSSLDTRSREQSVRRGVDDEVGGPYDLANMIHSVQHKFFLLCSPFRRIKRQW